ncbi:hypothetical protein [Motilibacter aurantiacus]|uniref:hypothetical protein n=1 Tax=Motilibacter aurantiacus TaxID=2714955 RepID=UPI0014082972|nr:hypothetical protein [Motilibacter aurantiacus]NHC43825.1 hypothetical protein [Motilibacter aurantiacus]
MSAPSRGAAAVALAVAVVTGSATVAHAAPAPAPAATPAPPVAPPTAPAVPLPPPPATPQFPEWIDDLAGYEEQKTCVKTAQPGTVGLQELLAATYPAISGFGITRACSKAISEHHEGRALDVMLDASDPEEDATAQSIVDWLTAPDAYGNQAAMARRLGVMYIIWDKQIWRAYRPGAGWLPYTGAEAHSDHIHISLSWAGALKRTTWWSLDPMTTPGIHLIDGKWWDVTCTYGSPPSATCEAKVKSTRVVYNATAKKYETVTGWARDRTTFLDVTSAKWDANGITHTGEFTSSAGRAYKVSCDAEAPAARTCDVFIRSTVVVQVSARPSYRRQADWVLTSVVKLTAAPPAPPKAAPTPKATSKPKSSSAKR